MASSLRVVSSLLLSVLLPFACSHDWDSLDPRLGNGGGTGSGATSSGGTAGNGSGGTGSSSTGGNAGGGGVVSGGGGSGGTGSGATGGNGGTGASGVGGGSGGADAGPMTTTYPANIAECIALDAPNPPACELTAGPGLMTIDTQTTITDGGAGNHETAGFVRFNLDSNFAGKTVLSVTLRLTAGNETNSDSSQSGEINAVNCFTLADLSSGPPIILGAVIAGNQGAVSALEVVNFNLPVTSVTAGQPACFGIFALGTDGVDYGNTKGASPPQLIVQYQ